jgi:hypothetical protein
MRKTPLLLAAGLAVVSAGCYRDFDFSSDSKADFAVVDGAGTWKDLGTGTTLMSGTATDIPVPGDWDGNHFWDKAVVKPGGSWVTGTSLGTLTYAPPAELPAYAGHPWLSVLPVPLDYDGDGDLEPAWYRESDGRFFIQGQDPAGIPFGRGPTATPGTGTLVTENDYDMPEVADYDGDGKDDLAVFNPVSGAWKIRPSTGGADLTPSTTGNESYAMPAPADYDGTGKALPAVFGPNGWIIAGHATDPFGAAAGGETGYPAVADFDGDGKADKAFIGWDTLNWYAQGAAITPQLNGSANDFPVPSGFTLKQNLARLNILGFCHDDPGACAAGGAGVSAAAFLERPNL